MQGCMPERRQIHERRVAMGRLQRQGQVHRHRGCPTPALGIYDGEYLATRSLFLDPALRCGQANKCLQQIGGGVGRSMNSRAPARIALTMTCGWFRFPMANTEDSGNS